VGSFELPQLAPQILRWLRQAAFLSIFAVFWVMEGAPIVNDCFALAMKRDHYNATHPSEEPLQVIFNFEEDIEEMKIAKGIEDDEAA
jgi:hypothetical protein